MTTVIVSIIFVFSILVFLFRKKIKKVWFKTLGAEFGIETYTENKQSPKIKERASETGTTPIGVYPNYIDTSDLFADSFHRCSKCGFGFIIKNNLLSTNRLTITTRTIVVCPRCKNTDD